MLYRSAPNKTVTRISPGARIYQYSSNSYYLINGKSVNEKGYWTKTKYDEDSSYSIDVNGYNEITVKSQVLGIRPVLNIKKSLLNVDSGVINITNIIKNATKIFYKYENELYDGFKYTSLQGMTVTNDKLIFMSANNANPTKSVMYAYKLNDLENLYKKDYNDTEHGAGMTYNSKSDKVLLVYLKAYEYNGKTLIREKEYERPPSYIAIGYDYNNDLYIGKIDNRMFMIDTLNKKKIIEFGFFGFETPQDLEYYNGYIFDCASDYGTMNLYHFYKGYEIIYIIDAKLDKDKKPTKNFGRIVARLIMTGYGELESISFRDGYIYFGFNQKGYNFYKMEYKKFAKEIKKIS